MEPQAFQLLMKRFDKVDNDNKEIKESLVKHVEEDTKVHATVAKHSTYWTLVMYIVGSIIAVSASVAVAFIR